MYASVRTVEDQEDVREHQPQKNLRWTIVSGLIILGLVGTLMKRAPAATQTTQRADVLPQEPNLRPVIGIVTLPCENDMAMCTSSYLAASYVKSVEAAGARVTPIHFFWQPEKIRQMLGQLNGVLFTGGDARIDPESPYFDCVKVIYEYVKQVNEQGTHYPLWGTCLGFESLLVLTAREKASSILSPFDALNVSWALELTAPKEELQQNTRIFAKNNFAVDVVLEILTKSPVTLNNHIKGVAPATFASKPRLAEFFNIVATNKDRNGLEFVSLIEAKKYPIWGVQFHPEKVAYEWYELENIPHSREAVFANAYFMDFFVDQARLNMHNFGGEDREKQALIYADEGRIQYTNTDFVQCYFW